MKSQKECELSWVEDLINYDTDTEDTLQQKIIMMYELIEKKSLENIEIKKETDIITAQIEVYKQVISKTKAARVQKEEHEQAGYAQFDHLKSQSNFHTFINPCYSPRTAMVNNTDSIKSPRKSFLKKQRPQHEPNIKKYSSIEDLWNNSTRKAVSPRHVPSKPIFLQLALPLASNNEHGSIKRK